MNINVLRNSLAKIDIFGQNITLNMNKNASYTTAFGGISSILIIVLLSLIFFSNIVEFFGKDNVFYNSEISFSNNPELMEINEDNSMFALAIDQVNFTTNPYFNISVEQKIYLRNKNGTLIKQTIEVPMQPCTLERFNNIFLQQGLDFTDQFNFLGMNKMLCPKYFYFILVFTSNIQIINLKSNFTFQMEGTYSSETFKFIKLTVKDCQAVNSTNNSLWNPTCSSSTEKAKYSFFQQLNLYLTQNAQFKLQIFQINTVVNPLKPNNYKSIYIDSDMYFSFVPFKLARLANVYYRQFIVNNDQSIMPYENIEQEKIIVRKAEDFRDLTELGRDTDDNYAIVYLRRSPFTETINRKYQKLGELLSYLGGFMQIMKVIFGFVIAFYNRTSMLIELANKLYDFQDNNKLKQYRTIKTLKYTEQIASPIEKLESNPINQLNNSQELYKVEWKEYIKQLVKKSKPITFNLRIFINQLTFGYLLKNKNSEFLEKAMQITYVILGIKSIMNQIYIVFFINYRKLTNLNRFYQENLKQFYLIFLQSLLQLQAKIIIDKIQLFTIQKNDVQVIPSRYSVEDLETGQSYIKSKEDTLNVDLFFKIEEAYKEIAEEVEKTNSNICQMNINLKLTQLIGQDIKSILKPIQNQRRNDMKSTEIQNINNNQDDVHQSDRILD